MGKENENKIATGKKKKRFSLKKHAAACITIVACLGSAAALTVGHYAYKMGHSDLQIVEPTETRLEIDSSLSEYKDVKLKDIKVDSNGDAHATVVIDSDPSGVDSHKVISNVTVSIGGVALTKGEYEAYPNENRIEGDSKSYKVTVMSGAIKKYKGKISIAPELATEQYRVDFDSDGGGDVSPQIIVFEGYAVQPSVKKDNHVLNRWQIVESEISGEIGSTFDFSEHKITHNLKLKAIWDKVDEYVKVTYDFGYKEGDKEVERTYEVMTSTYLKEPVVPVREGYTLVNWIDKETKTPWNFGEDKVTKAMTLVAQWNNEFIEYVPLEEGKSYGIKVIKTDNCPSSYTIEDTYKEKPITTIVGNAFSGCTKLNMLTMGNNITNIEAGAFTGCANLKYANFDKSKQWTIVKSDGFEMWSPSDNDAMNAKALVDNYHNKFVRNDKTIKTISCDKNIDFADSTIHKLTLSETPDTLKFESSNENIAVIEKVQDEHPYFKITLKDTTGAKTGTVTFTAYAQGYQPKTFDIEVASFKGLDFSDVSKVKINTSEELAGNKIVIPNRYYNGSTWVNVTGIDEGAFNSEKIQKAFTIILGENITSIPNNAFSGSLINGITISNKCESIAEEAFTGCTGLTTISIPSSVSSVGLKAFKGCSNLVTVTFGDSSKLTSIMANAFEGCKINTITLPESLTFIGDEAFLNNAELTTVTSIPKNVNHIGDNVFVGCSKLQSLSIDSNNKYYSSGDANAIIDISDENNKTLVFGTKGTTTVPSDVKVIGENTFNNCKGLSEITLPNGLTTIKKNAFKCCTGLTKIEIPASVTSIEENAFAECKQLAEITFKHADTSPLSLGAGAFSKTAITGITLPSTVKSIPDNLFSECDKLTSISLTKGIINIGSFAFYGCSLLSAIDIPEGVVQVGESAFDSCTSLTSIKIPSTMSAMFSNSFSNCTSLQSIQVSASNPYYGGESGTNEFNAIVDIGNGEVILGCKNTNLAKYTKGSILKIGENCFSNCIFASVEGKVELTIPSTIEEIGRKAFYNTNITSLTIAPKSGTKTKIDDNAFGKCSSLAAITLSEGIESIGDAAFSGSTITTLNIPASVSNISLGAFEECNSLATLTVESENKVYKSESDLIYKKDGDEILFGKRTGSVVIPTNDKITKISAKAFSNSAITSITIPKNITTIPVNAFDNCNSLTALIVDDNNTTYASVDNNHIVYRLKDDGEQEHKEFKGEIVFGARSASVGQIIIPDISDNPITMISAKAFANSAISGITIASTINSIESGAFSGCEDMTLVIIDSAIVGTDINPGNLFDLPTKSGTKTIRVKSDLTIKEGSMLEKYTKKAEPEAGYYIYEYTKA